MLEKKFKKVYDYLEEFDIDFEIRYCYEYSFQDIETTKKALKEFREGFKKCSITSENVLHVVGIVPIYKYEEYVIKREIKFIAEEKSIELCLNVIKDLYDIVSNITLKTNNDHMNFISFTID